MLTSITERLRTQAGAVSRASLSLQGAEFVPRVEITVGPGSDQSAENYLRFFTLGIDLSLPGYGIANDVLTPGHGYDPEVVAFYLALFTLIRTSPEPAHGLRL